MKLYNGFKVKEQQGARAKLPVGGYVCRIEGAREETYQTRIGEMRVLIMAVEVIEGEYAGFWKKDMDSQTGEDKKWRGTIRINVPKDDGSEMDGRTKNTFENMAWALEASNPGYVFDGDETKLKGKFIGVIYRNREYDIDGNTGWTTEAGGVTSVEKIRSNTYRQLKDKPLKKGSNSSNNNNSNFSNLSDADGDLPF